MNGSQFVGRVGGLAVMLGVGAAISLGQGIAWADDTPQTGPASGSTASGSVSSQTPGAPNSRRGAPPGSATPSDSGVDLASATAKTDTANAISAARTPKNGAAVSSRGAQQPRTGQSEPPSNTTARSGNESSTTEAPTGDRGSSAPPTTTSDTTTIDTGAGKADRLFSRKPVKQYATPASAADTTPTSQTTGVQAATPVAAGRPAEGQAAAGGEVTATVAPDTTRTVLSPSVTAAAALPAVSDPTPAIMSAAAPAPITQKTIVTDILKWIGLAALTSSVPVPDTPVPDAIATLWLAVREFVRTYVKPVVVISNSRTLPGYPDGTVFAPDGTRAVIATSPDGLNFTDVVVVDTATGQQVGNTLVLSGISFGAPLLNADGTRAVIITGGVTVINTVTGAQVGSTVDLTGQQILPPVLSSDGKRVLLTTTSTDLVSGGTRVTVIDTTTGTQIGTTLVLPGIQSVFWGADGTHVLTTTTDGDWDTGFTTRFRVIDTTTGTQVGATLTLGGRLSDAEVSAGPPFSADGTHAVIITDDEVGAVTRVAVINTTTGAQTGTTLTLAGTTSAVLSAGASRVLITTHVDETATHAASTLVTTIDTTTGAQIGSTLTLAGTSFSTVMSADGARALVTTGVGVGYTVLNTQATVINTATGAQTGTTVTLIGRPGPHPPLLSADTTRALVSNDSGGAVIINTTTGTQVGPTLALTGEPQAFDLVSADGTRALITTGVADGYGGTSTTAVSVIDTTTGSQVGTTVSFPDPGGSLLSADGTHALIITGGYDWTGPITRVAAIDTSTGQQTGFTVTLLGPVTGVELMADGTRALITTSSWNGYTGTGSTELTVIDIATGSKVGAAVTLSWGGEVSPTFSADGSHIIITPIFVDGLSQQPTVDTKVVVLEVV